MKNSNDLRVVKTKESLINAYLELLIKNTSSKVLDICKKANITYMTFYHHFSDKIDFQKYVINYQLQHILPIPLKLKPSGNKQLFFYLIQKLSLFFISNKQAISNSTNNVLKQGVEYSYVGTLNNLIIYQSELEINNVKELINDDVRSIIIKWFVGGLLFVLISSILNNKPIIIENLWKAIKVFASIINSKN